MELMILRTARHLSMLGLLCALLLSGCVTGSAGPSQAPLAASPTPSRGGILRVALPTAPATLDVQRAVDNPSYQVGDLLYEGLFRMTEGGPEPWLAQSVDVSADLKTWSLSLRNGVRFHDGTAFDAAAVKANLDRIRQGKEGFAYKALLAAVTEITVATPRVVELRLDVPSPTLRAVLAFSAFSMLSPTALATFGDAYSAHAAGTGPFRLISWTPGGEVALRRSDDYWGEAALLDEVKFTTIRDASARVAALEASSVDVAVDVPGADVKRLRNGERAKISIVGTPRLAMLQMNVSKPPLDNKLVRQAIMYATNRQAYVDTLLDGLAEVADSVTGPGVFGYKAQTPYPYDQQRARSLLAQAGVPAGTGLELVTTPALETLGSAIAQDLAAVGIVLKVVKIEQAAFAPYRNQGKHQLALFTRTSQYFDAELPIGTDFNSANWPPKGTNAHFYKNVDVDAALNNAKVEMDPAKRAALFARAQTLLWDDLPAIPLYRASWAVGIASKVQALTLTSQERLQLQRAWLRS